MALPIFDDDAAARARYEYRVWGRHRKARRRLARLATSIAEQEIRDCYLLVDDRAWNVKVRDDVLKLKRLVDERKGFEAWTADRHHDVDAVPEPFEEIYDALNLDRVVKGKSFDLRRAVAELDPELGIQAVFVTKQRLRHTVGDLRADVTDMTIDGTDTVLRSLSIEGRDLPALISLRQKLGLKGEPNVSVHEAIEDAL